MINFLDLFIIIKTFNKLFGPQQISACGVVIVHALTVGALTLFLWAFKKREKLMEFYSNTIRVYGLLWLFLFKKCNINKLSLLSLGSISNIFLMVSFLVITIYAFYNSCHLTYYFKIIIGLLFSIFNHIAEKQVNIY